MKRKTIKAKALTERQQILMQPIHVVKTGLVPKQERLVPKQESQTETQIRKTEMENSKRKLKEAILMEAEKRTLKFQQVRTQKTLTLLSRMKKTKQSSQD